MGHEGVTKRCVVEGLQSTGELCFCVLFVFRLCFVCVSFVFCLCFCVLMGLGGLFAVKGLVPAMVFSLHLFPPLRPCVIFHQ